LFFRFYSVKIIFVVLFYHPPAARTSYNAKMRKFLCGPALSRAPVFTSAQYFAK